MWPFKTWPSPDLAVVPSSSEWRGEPAWPLTSVPACVCGGEESAHTLLYPVSHEASSTCLSSQKTPVDWFLPLSSHYSKFVTHLHADRDVMLRPSKVIQTLFRKCSPTVQPNPIIVGFFLVVVFHLFVFCRGKMSGIKQMASLKLSIDILFIP